MKKIIRSIIVVIFLLATPIFMSNSFADAPPDPGGGGPGTGDLPVGGGAPIGGGLIIMLALGAAYGSKKTFDAKKSL
ncbi:MAG: hypothetical protein DRJ05_00750 [Bacteroidetes bacterium]|nr:MAG: hypothetical protein DRJ05_00750 [Bacteroidota bacterium]